jgi:dihydropteroate synthase
MIDRPAPRSRYPITLRGKTALLGARTWVMGVLNVTPDSFSDGGRYEDADTAIAHGLALFEAGADVVDVGGESTRPGAPAKVDAAEERRRVVPVVRGLRARGAGPLSIDTTKAEVAAAALDGGADMVNDVSGLHFDPAMGRLVAERGVPVVLMHLRGDFQTMHREPRYRDVMAEVAGELREALARAEQAGVRREQTIVDPGLGFAKDAGHTLEAIRRLSELAALERPLLVGPSRKSFIGRVLERPTGGYGGARSVPPLDERARIHSARADDDRLFGTAAAVAACILGGAHMVRVHDVREMVDVVRICDAVRGEAA